LSSTFFETDWKIVIVAYAADVDRLSSTVAELKKCSFGQRLTVLASDTSLLRAECADLSIDTQFLLQELPPKGQYWCSTLTALKFDGERTIFLRAGCHVPDCWDARLASVAARIDQAVAISPVSARHPLLGAYNEVKHKQRLDVNAVDQWLNDYVEGIEFDVPLILPSCAILQGNIWPSILSDVVDDAALFKCFKVENTLILATDQLYIDDSEISGLIDDIANIDDVLVTALIESNPLATVKHALTELSYRKELPPQFIQCKPVQLHVAHSWGGGLGRWVEDFVAADNNHNNLVLRSIGDLDAYGKKIGLYRSAEMDVPIRTWLLAQPIRSTAVSHYQYQQLLQGIIRDFNIESVMVSSLIGHSLDMMRIGLPLTFICHDFYPFCPAVVATYNTPCISCDSQKHAMCSIENPHHRFFTTETDSHWDAIRKHFCDLFMSSDLTAIAPSKSVVERYQQLVPEFTKKTFRVIEHGLSDRFIPTLSAARKLDVNPVEKRLRVVILGSLAHQKGESILGEIVEELTQFADLWLLGTGDGGQSYQGKKHVTVTIEYQREALGQHLSDIHADVGLLLSTVPETFSYTLSELWAAGLPVITTRIGAFATRIDDGQNGWLVEPQAADVMQTLKRLNENRSELESVFNSLHQHPIRTSVEMVAEYQDAEPKHSVVAVNRFFLCRRSHKNSYKNDVNQPSSQALHIDHQVPYRTVLVEFLSYTTEKTKRTPKIPASGRRILTKMIERLRRFIQ